MLALSWSIRAPKLSVLVARSMRELIARTVFWKLRLPPLRSVPRLMLSFFDGTQAEAPSGEIDDGSEVVRDAAALVLEVQVGAVTQDDHAASCPASPD